jgi:hypothetical protein
MSSMTTSPKRRILRSEIVSMPDISQIEDGPLISDYEDSSEQCLHQPEIGLFEKGRQFLI